MVARGSMGLVAGACVLASATLAHAQCTKDSDCKGDRVCEGGACVAPAAAPPAVPPAGQPAGTASPAPAAAVPAPASAPAPAAATPEPPPPEDPPTRRHSTGMMVGGIVMTSLAPVALLVAAGANNEQTSCELARRSNDEEVRDCDEYDGRIYGGLIMGAVLAGVGIPLIIIGGKKEPVTARITPWATAKSAGLGLRVDL